MVERIKDFWENCKNDPSKRRLMFTLLGSAMALCMAAIPLIVWGMRSYSEQTGRAAAGELPGRGGASVFVSSNRGAGGTYGFSQDGLALDASSLSGETDQPITQGGGGDGQNLSDGSIISELSGADAEASGDPGDISHYDRTTDPSVTGRRGQAQTKARTGNRTTGTSGTRTGTAVKAQNTPAGSSGRNGLFLPSSEVVISQGQTASSGGSSSASSNSVSYTVEHYKMDLYGGYPSRPSETETRHTAAGNEVSVSPKDYTGFSSPGPETVTVHSSDTATVRFYYTRNTHTLTVNDTAHARVTSDPSQGNLFYGEQVTLTGTPDGGYVFSGWNASGVTVTNGQGSLASGTSGTLTFTMPDRDVTVSPIVLAEGENANPGGSDSAHYRILFDGNGAGDGLMSPLTVGFLERMTLPECLFSRTGCTFAGWTTNADGSGASYADGASIKGIAAGGSTITLYARWSSTPYTLRFHANGGYAVTETRQIRQGEAYGELPVTGLTGYTLKGWYTSRVGGSRVTEESIFTVSYGTTLYAHWEAADLRLSYKPNGGILHGEGTAVIPYGTAIGEMPAAERVGYHFLGWYTAKTGGVRFTEDTLAEEPGETALYAHWDPRTDIPYRVEHYRMLSDGTYPSAPDDTDADLTGTTDTYVSPAPKATYGDGYMVPSAQTALVKGDGSLVVRYRYPRKRYAFTLGSAEGADTTASSTSGLYVWGAAITLNAIPDTGYSWTAESRWTSNDTVLQPDIAEAEASFIMPQGAITMTPVPSVNHYTLSFDVNGDDTDPVTVKKDAQNNDRLQSVVLAYTDEFPLDEDPATRPHYDFAGYMTAEEYAGTPMTWGSVDGWTAEKLSPIDGDTVTLLLRWAGKPVTITEGIFAGKTVNYGKTVAETLGELEDPAPRTGYTFQDWYASPDFSSDTLIRENTVIDATIFDLLESTGELYPLYTPNTYAVTFDLNDTTVSPAATVVSGASLAKTVTYDSTYGELLSVSRTGYDFTGWFTAATGGGQVTADTLVQITDDQTLYAHWIPKTYTVSFHVNDTDTSPADALTAGEESKTVTYDAAYGTLPIPTRTGYAFSGWFTGATDGSQATVSTIVRITADQTLYARWTPKTYTVSFHTNGTTGSPADALSVSDASKTVTYDAAYGVLPAPTRTGYSFTGWYTDPTGGGQVTADTIVRITADQTLYAHWAPRTYVVSFDTNGTTESPVDALSGADTSKTVTYDTTYGTQPTPTRTGYDFMGWFTGAADGSQVTATTIVRITEDRTLYARWSPKTYTVSFALNGTDMSPADPLVAGQESKNVTYDAAYGTLPAPIRTGYTFTGWFTDPTAGEQVTASTIVRITSDQTLYAQWAPKTYTVSFDTNGTTGSPADALAGEDAAKTVTYDAPYGTLPAPTRTGYAFTGWFTETSAGEEVTSSMIVRITEAQTLYAHWTARPYTVIFDTNGTVTSPADALSAADTSKTVGYDGTYGSLPMPTRTGYDFIGWFTEAAGGTQVQPTTVVRITADQTLYAHWDPKTYTITFNVNGGNALNEADTTKTVTYDNTYGALPSPTMTGFNFAGWHTATTGGEEITVSTVVRITEDTTLFAHWTIKTFAVTAEGDTHIASITGTGTKEWNSAVSVTATPAAGYHIGTWTDPNSSASPDSLPAGYTLSTDNKTLSFAQPEYAVALSVSTLPNTRTIHFRGNGAGNVAEMADQTLTYGVSTTLTANTYSKAHYHFLGWGLIAGGSDIAYGNGADLSDMAEFRTNPSGETTLYARWAVNSYAVMTSGDTHISTITGAGTKNWGTSVTLTATPITGYHVSAWSDANGGSLPTGSTISTDKTTITFPMPDNAVSLNVTSEPNTYAVTFMLTGDDETIQGVTEKTVTYDATYGTLPMAEKDHYEFLGWFTQAEGGTQRTATDTVQITANETLYPHWQRSYYELTLGETYQFGGYSWIAAEELAPGIYAMQSTGMTGGCWPGYKLSSNYSGEHSFGSGSDISYYNIANYNSTTSTWYTNYGSAEASGGRNASETYSASNAKNGLYLVPKNKCNVSSNATIGSGNYWSGLKTAATNYSSFGAGMCYAWLGSNYGTTCAWHTGPGGYICNDAKQKDSLVFAPTFNLDTSKIELDTEDNSIFLAGEPHYRTLTLGTTYSYGGYDWVCAEKLDKGIYAMQSTGMTRSTWNRCAFAAGHESASTYYFNDISYENIVNCNSITSSWYATYGSAEASGGRSIFSGEYYKSQHQNGLYLVPFEKCNVSSSGSTGSGNYWYGLKTAATNYSLLGGSYSCAWLGTYGSSGSCAWYVDKSGYVFSNREQTYGYVIAPVFNLDTSKIRLDRETNEIYLPGYKPLRVGTTYVFGGYDWICSEMLDNGIYAMQCAQAVTIAYWPGYEANGESVSTDDYIYTDFSSLYAATISWYGTYKDAEAAGGRNSSGIYSTSTSKNGLYLIPQAKATDSYLAGLKTAASSVNKYVWLGTSINGNHYANCVNSSGVFTNYNQDYTLAIAPAFNIDTTKVNINGTTINLP